MIKKHLNIKTSQKVGLLIFTITTIVNYISYQHLGSLLLIGAYIVYIILSSFQEGLLIGNDSLALGYFGYHFILWTKTFLILSGFILPGSFGNIHSNNFINVLNSIFLFLCLLFVIVNFFLEICFATKKTHQINLLIGNNKNIPTMLFKVYHIIQFVFITLIFMTLIVYILAVAVLGPLWLLIFLLSYAILNTFSYMMLLGKHYLTKNVGFILISIMKFLIPFLIYLYYGSTLNPSMETTVFVNVYKIFVNLNFVLLCLTGLIDLVFVYIIFKLENSKE